MAAKQTPQKYRNLMEETSHSISNKNMTSSARPTPAKAAQAGSSSSWQSDQQSKANELTRLQNMASHVKVLDSPFFPKNTSEYIAHQTAMQDEAKAAMQHKIDQKVAAQGVKGPKIEPAYGGKSVPSLSSIGGDGGGDIWKVGPHDASRPKGIYASARGLGAEFGGDDGWPDKPNFKKFGDARAKLGFERVLPPPGKKFQQDVQDTSSVVSRDGSPSKSIQNLRSRSSSPSKVKGMEGTWNQYAAQSGFLSDMERRRQYGAQSANWSEHAAYEAAWKAWAYGSRNVLSDEHEGFAGIWNDYGAHTGPWNEHGATFGSWPDVESGYGQHNVTHGAFDSALSQTRGYDSANEAPVSINKSGAHEDGNNQFTAHQFGTYDFASTQFGFAGSYDYNASQFAPRQTESPGIGSSKFVPKNAVEKVMQSKIRATQEKANAQEAAYTAMVSNLNIQGDTLKGNTRKSDQGTPGGVLKACAKNFKYCTQGSALKGNAREFEYGGQGSALRSMEKASESGHQGSNTKGKGKEVESNMMRILERKLSLPRLDTTSAGARWPANLSDRSKVCAWKTQEREREQKEGIGSWLDPRKIKIPTAKEIAKQAQKEQEEYVPEGGWTFDERSLRIKGDWAGLLDAIDK